MVSSHRSTVFRALWVGMILMFAFSAASIVRADQVPTVTLSPIAGPTVTVGDTAAFTASATDSDASSTIAYGLNGAPSGATIDSLSGVFSWNTTAATSDTYAFSVTATGSTGGSDSKNVAIVVNAPPQMQVATSTDGTGGHASTVGGTIVTGDAAASTTVGNQLNLNSANPDVGGNKMNSSSLFATSTNDGVLQSNATSTATTGNNTATGGDGASLIITGNAVSTANVINEINTNIFNSDGLILFLNQMFGGGIDLNNYDLSYFFAGGPGASPYTTIPGTTNQQCTLLTCLTSSQLNVINTNTATVTNSVIVRSSTGGNTASSTSNATIGTGAAYAAANVLNLVNTNIINSSYLLLSFNNFGDLGQDITLPSDKFFNDLFANGGQQPTLKSSTYTVNNTNTATTTGSVTADAGTGNNMASTTTDLATSTTSGSGIVTTGNAYSSASTFNQQNTTNIGGTSVFMLFRVSGIWSGTVEGLPAGMSWFQTPDGIEVVSNNASTTPPGGTNTCTYEYKDTNGNIQYSHSTHDHGLQLQGYQLVDTGTVGGSCFISSSFLASSTNTATLEDNVSVSAQTGDNTATTGTGTSSVSTGNAYAVANVVNLVNTDIVGQNWIFAVFNIFGNWNGNIRFGGSPNLAISALPVPDSTAPGSDVTYTFTVTNSGTSDANNVLLNASFDNTLLSFAPAGVDATSTPTGQSWHLGLIPQGAARTFSFIAHVGNHFPAGVSAIVPLTAAAVNDNITSPSTSNTADAHIIVTSPPPASTEGSGGSGSGGTGGTSGGGGATGGGGGGSGGGGGGSGGGGGGIISSSAGSAGTDNPKILVVKTVSVAMSTTSMTADYRVVITNEKNAGPVYSGLLTDTLYDPSSAVMYNRSWDLSTIAPGDEIDLTYSVAYATSTKPGIYHNVARVTGKQNYPGGSQMTPVEGSGDIQFTPTGSVLGVSTSTIPFAISTLLLDATSTTPIATSTKLTIAKTATSTPSGACAQFLSTFLRRGMKNDTGEVKKLQQFLNTDVGITLPQTGFFGPLTESSVKVFQIKYKDRVLAPLGLTIPTGAVFSMTQHAINELACAGAVPVTYSANPVQQPALHVSTPPKPLLKKGPKQVQTTLPLSGSATNTNSETGAASPDPKTPGFQWWLQSLVSSLSSH